VLDGTNRIRTIYAYDEMRRFFNAGFTYIGHNIACYDLLVAEKILGVSPEVSIEDTLYMSQYIFPSRRSYSLESFGQNYGVEKVQIDDWNNLTQEDYRIRCETDVAINLHLYNHIINKINFLYDNNEQDVKKIIGYLSLKAFFASRQVKHNVYIDRNGIVNIIARLGAEREQKVQTLKASMPKVAKYVTRHKPKVMRKADGSVSKIGQAWVELCEANGLLASNEEPITVVSSYADPNPLSILQIKDWLTSLGWKPATIKYLRDKQTNETTTVPQVYKEDKSLCDSVLLLAEKDPAIYQLEGLGILNHRIEQLEGLLKYSSESGYLCQELFAITPTFRFRHGKVVNLPSVDKAYGKDIRGLFKAPSGHRVVGCDIKALEDQCKLHYIAPIDPEYVKEISKPGYDPHLALAVSAGFLTPEQAEQHKKGEADYSKQRKLGKICNFSSQYSVGQATLARNTGLTEKQAKMLLDAYWERNWAIKKFSSECDRKNFIDNSSENKYPESWVRSPLTGFWMHLRNEKDIFSVVTQSAGVWIFDNFVANCIASGINIPYQSHDEIMFYCKEDSEEETKNILRKCIDRVNQKLKLNVVIDIDIKIADDYAGVH